MVLFPLCYHFEGSFVFGGIGGEGSEFSCGGGVSGGGRGKGRKEGRKKEREKQSI